MSHCTFSEKMSHSTFFRTSRSLRGHKTACSSIWQNSINLEIECFIPTFYLINCWFPDSLIWLLFTGHVFVFKNFPCLKIFSDVYLRCLRSSYHVYINSKLLFKSFDLIALYGSIVSLISPFSFLSDFDVTQI